jgi:hypothetical protein
VKALTIRQPWAWAIARGHKTIENRTWATSYRGPLAIHAAKKPDDGDALSFVLRYARLDSTEAFHGDRPTSDRGRIVAVADLVDICTRSLSAEHCGCGVWAMWGHAHWKLGNVRLVDGPEISGRLGLWEWDREDHHDG